VKSGKSGQPDPNGHNWLGKAGEKTTRGEKPCRMGKGTSKKEQKTLKKGDLSGGWEK